MNSQIPFEKRNEIEPHVARSNEMLADKGPYATAIRDDAVGCCAAACYCSARALLVSGGVAGRKKWNTRLPEQSIKDQNLLWLLLLLFSLMATFDLFYTLFRCRAAASIK